MCTFYPQSASHGSGTTSSPLFLSLFLSRSVYIRIINMSAAIMQAASLESMAVRVRVKRGRVCPRMMTRRRTAARAAAHCRVSCAATAVAEEAVKDKRIPVTVLTGFLG